MPKRKYNRDTELQICQEYWTPLPDGTWPGSNQLAKKWGFSKSDSILHILRKHGFRVRTSKERFQNTKGGKQKACKPITNKPPEGETPPLCECGCKQQVEWSRSQRRWKRFIGREHRPGTRTKPKTPVTCGCCSTVFHVIPSRVGRAKYCSRRCQNTMIGQQVPRAYTSIELALARELTNQGISFKTNKPVAPGIRPDIILDEVPVIIEADGDYWHSLPAMKKRRVWRDKELINLGYQVFHFTETQINANAASCIQEVLQYLD